MPICIFTAAGYSVKFDGFTALYEESSDEDDDESGKNQIDDPGQDDAGLKEGNIKIGT